MIKKNIDGISLRVIKMDEKYQNNFNLLHQITILLLYLGRITVNVLQLAVYFNKHFWLNLASAKSSPLSNVIHIYK